MVVTLPDSLERALDHIALRTGRTPNDLAREALALFLTDQFMELEERENIRLGIEDIEAGRYQSFDDAADRWVATAGFPADWRKWLEEAERAAAMNPVADATVPG